MVFLSGIKEHAPDCNCLICQEQQYRDRIETNFDALQDKIDDALREEKTMTDEERIADIQLATGREVDTAHGTYNDIRWLLDRLAATERERDRALETHCQLSGPGRGDCFHYVGVHNDTDVYGKPAGWCWWCWKSYKQDKAESERDAALTLVKVLERALIITLSRLKLSVAGKTVRDADEAILNAERALARSMK